eukprot:3875789-Ditylum_brightwellii.AAC.1
MDCITWNILPFECTKLRTEIPSGHFVKYPPSLAKESIKLQDFNNLFNELQQEEDTIMVPTNKMNNYKVVDKDLYTKGVQDHLSKAAQPLQCSKMLATHNEAT